MKIKTYQFNYSLNSVELSCELEYQHAYPATQLDPPEDAYAILHQASTASGDEIYPILSDEQISEIETAFCEQQGASDWSDEADYQRDQRSDEAAELHWNNVNSMAKMVCGVRV